MKMEIWFDYACPFCYIEKRQLENALESFVGRDDLEITYRAFELDPDADCEKVVLARNAFMSKYGYTSEQANKAIEDITEIASIVGLNFNYHKALYTNTFDAHRISKYAETKGKGVEIVEKLLYAFFIENRELNNHNVLIDIAMKIGLDKLQVEKVLKSDKFTEEVRYDELKAKKLGIRTIPYCIIDEKYSISGAQSADMIKKIIEKILSVKSIENENLIGMSCGVNGCGNQN